MVVVHTSDVAVAAADLRIDAATVSIVAVLEAHHVPTLLLKGPVIASWLYGSDEVRPYRDIDLLVPVAHFGEAERVLGELGFARASLRRRKVELVLAGHGAAWLRQSDGMVVDLHTGFHGLGVGEAVWEVLSEGAQQVGIAGGSVRVPSPSRRALIVAAHALHHAGERWCALDLERCLQRCPPEVWLEAAQAAEELGVARTLSRALCLLPAGIDLLERLPLDPEQTQEEFDWRVAAAALDVNPDQRGIARDVAALHETAGWLNRARLALESLVPSPGAIKVSSPLARRGRAGLVAAYLWRPGRLALRLPPVLWAFHVERRSRHRRRISLRVEVLAWALLSRLLLPAMGLRRSLSVLDLAPASRRPFRDAAPLATDVRGGGACLARALARSQYLRRRHVDHAVVIGVAKPAGGFAAHAWVEPFDRPPPGYEEIRRIKR